MFLIVRVTILTHTFSWLKVNSRSSCFFIDYHLISSIEKNGVRTSVFGVFGALRRTVLKNFDIRFNQIDG